MINPEAAIARVRDLQTRVGASSPEPEEGFQEMLDATLAKAAQTGPLQSASLSTQSGYFTIGQLIGAIPVSSMNSVFFQRPPVDGVLTRVDLDAYVEAVGVRTRNGRLWAGDLTAVTGGWAGHSGDLLEPAAVGWEKMREAAESDGIDLYFVDSYRNWAAQDAAYGRFLRGEKSEHVLPAGLSEHGVGLAVDITNGAIIRRGDEEWRWLQANASAFGWHMISNETWHWEFRGT